MSRRSSRGLWVEAGVMALAGAIGLYEGLRLSRQPMLWKDTVGPGWFLVAVAVGLLVVSAIILWKGDTPAAVARDSAAPPLWRSQPFWLVVAFVAYTATVPYAGYLVASFAFFTAALRISGMTTWLRSAAVSAIVTAAFYAFCRATGIPLP